MECNNNNTSSTSMFYLVSICWVLLFQYYSIPAAAAVVGLSSTHSSHHQQNINNNNNNNNNKNKNNQQQEYVTSTTPPVLIPTLETWARAMQLSFRSISEPPMQSQFPSRIIGSIQSQTSSPDDDDDDDDDDVLPTTLLFGSSSHRTTNSVAAPFLDGNPEVLEKTMKSIAWLIKLGSIQAQRLSNTRPLDEKDDEAGKKMKILQICKHNYDKATTNLQEAMKALASKNAKRMHTMLHAVLSNVGECRRRAADDESSFGKRSLLLATYEDKVTKMTNNCLIVLDLSSGGR